MKKGELRRQEILDTAERLFLSRGYEQTSVQDILDEMGLSKGGFYHHFDTKMALLEAISERRCESQFGPSVKEILRGRLNPVEKINRLFSLMNVFEREEPEYIRMLLRVCYLGGDTLALECARRVTTQLITPAMDEIVLEGVRAGALYTRHPGGVGRLLVLLAQDMNDEAAKLLCAGNGNPESVVGVIDMLNVYRDSVEALIDAPYGSIRLFDVDRVLRVLRETIENFSRETGEEI